MKKITILIIGFISLLATQAMSQEAPPELGPRYTVVGFILEYRHAFIPFIIILVLKFIKKLQITEIVNLVPFFTGLAYALLHFVRVYNAGGLGHVDRMINNSLEVIAFGSIFTVLLIVVDVIRGLTKSETKNPNHRVDLTR